MLPIGGIAQAFGINLGDIAGKAVNGLLGNSNGSNILGSVLSGATNFLTGNPIGAIGSALNAFQGLANTFQPGTGQAGMFGGPQGQNFGRFPQAPGMGGGLGAQGSPFGGMGNIFGGGGAGMQGLPGLGGAPSAMDQMKQVMNNPNMTPEQKQLAMQEIQEKKQQFDQLLQMLTNLSKSSHQTAMAVIGNMR